MADPRSELQGKWAEAHRFNNFGNALTQLRVQGFRCHEDTVIEVQSPITAFAGPNGTGKTTLLQVASCAYSDGHYLRFFFKRSPMDPSPIHGVSVITYRYANHGGGASTTSLRPDGTGRKQGRRRMSRRVVYVGVGEVLPFVEKKGTIYWHAEKAKVGEARPLPPEVAEWAQQVLKVNYRQISENDTTLWAREYNFLSVNRGDAEYSEFNMGFGERRTLLLIKQIEAAPPKSLILLEEPEISLHQYAQLRLGEYLVNVANRRGHQIFLTTHSEHLLRALPEMSRIYLHRDSSERIQVIPGLTASQMASLMAEGQDRSLTVLVEDPAAKIVLEELIRVVDPVLRRTVRIISAGWADTKGQIHGGGHTNIRATMKALKLSGLRVAAVLDGDQAADPSTFVFKLPGTQPPERALLSSSAVRAGLVGTYQDDDVNTAIDRLGVHDHHKWFSILAHDLGTSSDVLMTEAARLYANALSHADRSLLVKQLREAADRR